MIQLEFSEADLQHLHHERYHHPHPRVQMKMEALYLKAKGLPHGQIADYVGVCENTLRGYLREYQAGGIDRLKHVNFYRPTSDLEDHRPTLEAYFADHPSATIAEAIEHLTGIKRQPTQIRVFLKKLGLKRRKTAAIPAKYDEARQEDCKKKALEPRLAEAEAGERAVFFVDAAPFVHRCFLGFLWCFQRVFVRAPSGRKRFNVLAALNAVTHDLIMVTNETYITADSVCELLTKLAQSGLTVPISVVLDNASYQHCAKVLQCATELGIELVFLPPYSPNLNLIERLWRFVRGKCLYGKYYATFKEFKGAIETCLHETGGQHRQALDSLMTLKFQRLGDLEL